MTKNDVLTICGLYEAEMIDFKKSAVDEIAYELSCPLAEDEYNYILLQLTIFFCANGYEWGTDTAGGYIYKDHRYIMSKSGPTAPYWHSECDYRFCL